MQSILEGIINFHKPTGITSAGALYKMRSLTQQRKSGHAGTLDPAASGVLVLCLGKATKLVERIMDQPKVYRTAARLDVTSESYDSDRPLTPVEVVRVPTPDDVRQAVRSFEGEIMQTPPRISAVKINGQPAYKRVGSDSLELKPRPARIYWLCVHQYEFPLLTFEMCCGRGTYVRSLIRDLGRKLGTGGCLTSLVRTRVGPFGVEDAWTLDAMQQAADPDAYLLSLDRAQALLDPSRIEIPSRPAPPGR